MTFRCKKQYSQQYFFVDKKLLYPKQIQYIVVKINK